MSTLQRTEQWYADKVGKVSASRIPDVMAKTKSGPSAYRETYMGEVIAERLTGKNAESFVSGPMQWGIDTEEEARAVYQFERMTLVELVGFVDHPTIPMAGSSPDGKVGTDGLVEIKCPNTATHIKTLLSQTVPSKYYFQMQFQMACTGREWCDFVSYDPRMPENMRIWIKRIHRDEGRIAEIEREVRDFLAEVDEKVSKLKSKYESPAKEAA